MGLLSPFVMVVGRVWLSLCPGPAGSPQRGGANREELTRVGEDRPQGSGAGCSRDSAEKEGP